MKTLTQELQELLDERGPQLKTRVRDQLPERFGSRNIRNMVEEALDKIGKMLDPSHASMNPADSQSEARLKMAEKKLRDARDQLKEVRDSASKRWEDSKK